MGVGQDSEPPEAIDRMDKAELEELEKKTLEELADIDQQIATSLAEPDAVYSLLEQKAAKELLLSRIGRGMLLSVPRHDAGARPLDQPSCRPPPTFLPAASIVSRCPRGVPPFACDASGHRQEAGRGGHPHLRPPAVGQAQL